MPAEDVARAEAAVGADPDALEARVRLVGAYFSKTFDRTLQAKRDLHVHWIIRHHPELDLGPMGAIFPIASPAGYAEGRRLWLEAVAQHPSDPRVLCNAMFFVFLHDPDIAEDLAKRGIDLAPSPEWHETLASIYESRTETASPADRVSLAASIVEQHERVLASLDDADRCYPHWIDVARWAVEAGDIAKARHHAALVLANEPVLDADRDCHGTYWANIVLGKIALTVRDVAKASEHLAAATAAAAGTPFYEKGPDLGLAAALLASGARDAVVRYLVELERLWPDWAKPVRATREAVERGDPVDLEQLRRDRFRALTGAATVVG
jgi:hypothetical protein